MSKVRTKGKSNNVRGDKNKIVKNRKRNTGLSSLDLICFIGGYLPFKQLANLSRCNKKLFKLLEQRRGELFNKIRWCIFFCYSTSDTSLNSRVLWGQITIGVLSRYEITLGRPNEIRGKIIKISGRGGQILKTITKEYPSAKLRITFNPCNGSLPSVTAVLPYEHKDNTRKSCVADIQVGLLK